MQNTDEETATRVRVALAPIAVEEGAVRSMALKGGISEPTIRKIIETGVVSSRRTAAALEVATDGRVPAAMSMQPGARGEDLYGRKPASIILQASLDQGVSVTEVLSRLGITHQDLWVYMNHGEHLSQRVKTRVKASLDLAGLPSTVETKA